MRSAVFSYVPRICTDFIQDKNVVDCLACSLSLVQHSRYCIFLFDEIINYGAAYSMGSLTGGRITIGTTYIRTRFMRGKLIYTLIPTHAFI
jgi:hypothetical protein